MRSCPPSDGPSSEEHQALEQLRLHHRWCRLDWLRAGNINATMIMLAEWVSALIRGET
jgi:hypothetical protein